MTTQNLLQLVATRRASENASGNISKAIEEYTDGQCDFWGDQILKQFIYDIMETQYGDNFMEIITDYVRKGEYVVFDWTKVVPDSEGKKYIKGGKDMNPHLIKEIIKDDERFVEHMLEGIEHRQICYDALAIGGVPLQISFLEEQPTLITLKKEYACKSINFVDGGTTVRAFPTEETSPTNFVIVQGKGETTQKNADLVFFT